MAAHAQACERAERPWPGWVVDTGASRHVCSPTVAGSALQPSDVTVENANGTVRVAGEAHVRVPGLRSIVPALVMEQSPCLLSAGQLVRRGYSLMWPPAECVHRSPAGEDIRLDVIGGIPVMREGC